MSLYHLKMDSPLGTLRLFATEDALTHLFLPTYKLPLPVGAVDNAEHPVLLETREQLHTYFEGTRTEFDIPVSQEGTDFQVEVWSTLQEIPYGEVWSYQQLAETIGRPKAVRAVGAANGRNAISIIVPCHRVMGGDGSLTGYAGGVDAKRWLLEHEGYTFSDTSQLTLF